MSIVDVVVLVITLAAVLYSIVNSILVVLNPEKYKKVTQIEDNDELEPPVAMPPAAVSQSSVRSKELSPQEKFRGEKFTFRTKMDEFRQKSSVEDRSLPIGLRSGDELVSEAVRLDEPASSIVEHKRAARLDAIVNVAKSKKMLWIAHEIVSPPIALRPFPLPWNK